MRKAVSLKRPVYEQIQEYRASYLMSQKRDISFSAALSQFAEDGMKAKGLWKK